MSSGVGGATGAAVRELNRWSVPGVGRDYQLQLLTTGTLLIDGDQIPYSTVPISYDRFELRHRLTRRRTRVKRVAGLAEHQIHRFNFSSDEFPHPVELFLKFRLGRKVPCHAAVLQAFIKIRGVGPCRSIGWCQTFPAKH